MLVQNENADTVVVFRANSEVGFGSCMIGMMRWIAMCQKRGYYFILDEACSLPFRFTSVFKPFWDDRINQKMLGKAQRIYVIGYKRNDEPYVINDERVVYDLYSWNIDDKIKNTQKNHTALRPVNTKNFFPFVHQLNDDIQAQVCLIKQSLQLPKYYQMVHIRRGDHVRQTFLNTKLCPPRIEEFLEELDPDIKDVYIATDTLKVIKQIKAKDKNGHRFHSLIYENYYPHITETRWGNFMRSLSHIFAKISGKLNPHRKKVGQQNITESLLYVLTDIDICRNAEKFIGTRNSTFSAYLVAVRKNRKERISYCEWRKCGWFEYLTNYLTIYHLYWSIRRIFHDL